MRKKIVAGNWKMNQDTESIISFSKELNVAISELQTDNELLICPPFTYITLLRAQINPSLKIGSQDVSYAEKGAYTGEVSASMLKNIGVEYCLVGHSERREYFNETSEILIKKIEQLISKDIKPIFCCGENLSDRKANNELNIIAKQIEEVLFCFSIEAIQKIAIAYEPIWAIGTGITATPNQAQQMHAFIRKTIEDKFGINIANNISILYGGSVTAENSKELFQMPDIDGGLVGGASLKADSFIKIINNI